MDQMVKNLQCRRPGFNPWAGKIPQSRKWQPTPAFLPGEFHGWAIVHEIAKSLTQLSNKHRFTGILVSVSGKFLENSTGRMLEILVES